MRPHLTLPFCALALLIAGTLSARPSPAAAGACATTRHFTTAFAASDASQLPADGALLFYPQITSSGTPARPRRAPPSEVQLRDRRGRALEGVRTELAPGWFRVQLPEGTRGRVALHLDRERWQITASAPSSANGAPAPALAAPRSARLNFRPPREYRGPRGRGMSSAYNTLTLSAPAPAGTFAVRVVRPATSQGFAMTLEAPDQVAFTFSPQAGRCQPNPPGQLLSAGVDVDISFLDRFGRESPTRRVSVR